MRAIEIETIVESYDRLIGQLSDTKTMLTHYPSLVYPESLLPCPKPIIKKAIEAGMEIARHTNDEIQLMALERDLWYLDAFIQDEIAKERNEILLKDKSYWRKLETVGWIATRKSED